MIAAGRSRPIDILNAPHLGNEAILVDLGRVGEKSGFFEHPASSIPAPKG